MTSSVRVHLVWVQQQGKTQMMVHSNAVVRARAIGGAKHVQVSNLTLPWVTRLPKGRTVYRAPVVVAQRNGQVTVGPIYAILAGNKHFSGSRANFRDILHTAAERGAFVYVLPPQSVKQNDRWTGYVRVGRQRWLPLPCPRPEVVYNRIPNRALERTPQAVAAKAAFARRQVPFFNPDYFNKADIYKVIRRVGLMQYLPDTLDGLSRDGFERLLQKHRSVYLKPSSGSVGHGIIRVDEVATGWQIQIVKGTVCQTYHRASLDDAWRVVQRRKLGGQYVMQATVERIQWNGNPCDLRVLLQKHRGDWHVVGKGVRAAGLSGVTTHLPNGGSIAPLTEVLEHAFAADADDVNGRIDEMVVQCARAIDNRYGSLLGEMSMDLGVDFQGNIWFFEANAKPMKFDEPDIRRRSLLGLLEHMNDLRNHPVIR